MLTGLKASVSPRPPKIDGEVLGKNRKMEEM